MLRLKRTQDAMLQAQPALAQIVDALGTEGMGNSSSGSPSACPRPVPTLMMMRHPLGAPGTLPPPEQPGASPNFECVSCPA